MDIGALRLFCDIVSCHNFARGAARHHVSQSAASQTIHSVERHMGVQLIDRSKRPFLLTSAGQNCYETFREIIDRFDTLSSQVRAMSDEISGLVRAAAIYSVGLHDLNLSIQSFMRQYPKARMRLEYLRPNKVYEAVLEETADLGIVSYPAAMRGLRVIALRDENMVLVANPRHRLAGLKRVTIDQLRGETYIAFDRDLPIRKAIDRYLAGAHAPVEIVMELDNIETIKQAIEIGAGVSILPEPTVRQEIRNGTLVIVPLAIRELTRPIGIIHRQHKMFTPQIARFIEVLRKGALQLGDTPAEALRKTS